MHQAGAVVHTLIEQIHPSSQPIWNRWDCCAVFGFLVFDFFSLTFFPFLHKIYATFHQGTEETSPGPTAKTIYGHYIKDIFPRLRRVVLTVAVKIGLILARYTFPLVFVVFCSLTARSTPTFLPLSCYHQSSSLCRCMLLRGITFKYVYLL